MRLIAKKGTALEQTLKEMCEKIDYALSGARDIVEKAVGVRPKNIYFMFHWGTIIRFLPEFDFDPADVSRINPKYLRKKKFAKPMYWVPSLRYKEGKKLDAMFRGFARENEVTDEPLHEFGIHMVDKKNGVSYRLRPAHDTENDRYMLICSLELPKAFDKNKLAKDQFEIEY